MIHVSIIVPVYNASNFIATCIDSVSRQTANGGVECLFIDDCSSDNSTELISDYIQSYKGNIEFRLLKQTKNQGPSAARNRGIIEAKGDYLFFLDSDDELSSDCISKLVTLADKYDADYVQGTYFSDANYHMPYYSETDNASKYCGTRAWLPEFSDDRKFIKTTLLNFNIIPFTPHNRLVKRQLLLDNNLLFNERICVREDFYWMFFIAKVVTRLAVCKDETYIRGYNEGSLTHDVKIDREILGSRTLIEDFSQNIDPFMMGSQKELLLETLIMTLNQKFYSDVKDRQYLIRKVCNVNSVIESVILRIYLCLPNGSLKNKMLHLLTRLYKIKDR